MGYAETVGLVAHVLHHAQSLAVLVDIQRNAVAGEIDFLKPFRDSGHCYHTAQTHCLQSLHSGRKLPFAAIHHHELG